MCTWTAIIGFLAIGLAAPVIHAQEADAIDPEYVRVTNERADKIVATLGVDDADASLRVRNLIAQQYRTLSKIHEARDSKSLPADKAADDQLAAHRRFVARLEARLTHEQVEQVKDGLTYGVVPLTFRAYQELLPDLTAEQKLEILAHLLEAREYAMDAGSSDAKHAVFGKYKGRINNYLSAEGFDLKQAEINRRR